MHERRGLIDRSSSQDFPPVLYACRGMDDATRRRKKPSPQLRGERVVQKILDAAAEELSLKGFGALSIEEVAERAGVAKTTVYRRWPTKADLAVAAMHQVADDIIKAEDTGSLRGDLTALLTSFRDFAWSPRGQGLMRMMVTDVMNAEIAEFARRVREEKAHEPREIVLRAIARGELPRGTDATLLVDVVFSAVQHYLCFVHVPVSDGQIARIIELVLRGAEHGGAVASKGARAAVTSPRRSARRSASP